MAQVVENLSGETETGVFNLSYLVLAVLLLLTLGVTYNFYKSAKTKDSIRFSNQINRFNNSIENNINLYVALLSGSKGFIETTPNLSRKNFADYINSLDLQNKYTGVQGIGFSKIISPAERADIVRLMQSREYSDSNIFPVFQKDFQQAVLFFEPLNESNRRAIGFDMSVDPNRQEAMTRARETGNASATGKVALIQEKEGENQSGFLIYLPVYANESNADSTGVAARRVQGFVFSPFRGNKFLSEIHKNIPDKDIEIKIYDASADPSNLIAQSENRNLQTDNLSNITDEHYAALSEVQIAGRKWVIEYNSLPSFAEQSSVSWTPLILTCGFILSLILFGLTYWEAAARFKMEKTAAELFELQKQKQILLENERDARQTAEYANATKDDFISIISHELKTPLNAIAGWTRILKTNEISANTKSLALQKIDKNLRAQASLVEQLLGYSEIIAGKTNLQKEEIDFAALFQEAINEIKPLADEKKIELQTTFDAGAAQIAGDREKLKIAIQNLLTNAVKFSQNGGKIETAIARRNGNVELTVKDYGRGINADFLPQIFERYKQADNPNVRDYGGLGLGLTVTRHIINLHKGKITAHSDGKGKGSTFTIVLPTGSST